MEVSLDQGTLPQVLAVHKTSVSEQLPSPVWAWTFGSKRRSVLYIKGPQYDSGYRQQWGRLCK